MLDQVDAALVPLKVVKAEQEIYLIVFEDSERALNSLVAAYEKHVSKMYSSKNFRLADTYCHACKPRIQLVHQIASLSTSLRNDGALSTTVDKCLYWMTIYLCVDIEHSYITEELRVIFKCSFVVCLNHLLANFIFNHLLSLYVVGVGIP